MSVLSRLLLTLVSNPQGDIKSIFCNSTAKAQHNFSSALDLILIVLKASSTFIYYAIKQALDVVESIAL